MYKILWIAPNSLHDLASATAQQERSLLDFFTKLNIHVTVLSMPIFSKFHPDCIDPLALQFFQANQNRFTQDGVQYIYSNAKTSFDQLPVTEQRAFLNLCSSTIRQEKVDAVFCSNGDILTSTLLLEARLCKIPTIFVLNKPIYTDFDFSLVDLILSMDSALSARYAETQGRYSVEIGPWCFNPLPSTVSNKQDNGLSQGASAEGNAKHGAGNEGDAKHGAGADTVKDSIYHQYGSLLTSLLELNQQAFTNKLSAQEYREQLSLLESKFSTELVREIQDKELPAFNREVLIGHVEVPYALNQLISLVLNASQDETLSSVRFVFNERHAEQLKLSFNQVLTYTLQVLKAHPQLLEIDPNLGKLLNLSYEEFIKLPQVKVTQGHEQLVESLKSADIYLDLSLKPMPTEFIVCQALSYGIPVLTTAQKQPPCELNAGLVIYTLTPNCTENPLLVPLSQDTLPLIELVKAFLQTDKLKLQANCFKALQDCQSLEQALRCYQAILPYLKRKAGINPHLLLNSMFDLRKSENKR